MQGRLRKEHLSVVIETECAHCKQPIHIEMDSDLKHRVVEADAAPMVYVPLLDVQKLNAPSIIDGF